MTSIFTRASEMDVRKDILIFSEINRGKTKLAVNIAAQEWGKVLYVAFGAMYPNLPDNWDTMQVFNKLQLTKTIAEIAKSDYDCVIFDNYNTAIMYFAPKTDTPTRQEYGQMAVRWTQQINEVRQQCDNFIMTINVVNDEQDNGASAGLKLDVNPRMHKNIQTLFNLRHFTWIGGIMNPETKQTETTYFVVTDEVQADKFTVTADNSIKFQDYTLDKVLNKS